MKVLVFLAVVALATSVLASPRRTRATTDEDDGQYHPESSDEYNSDKSVDYQKSSFQGVTAQARLAQVVPSLQYRQSYSNNGEDDGQYHSNSGEDDGQYHEDHSGDYNNDNGEAYSHVGSRVEPYIHTPDQLVPYKPFSDSGSYKQVLGSGAYHQVGDNGAYKYVGDGGSFESSSVFNAVGQQGASQYQSNQNGGLSKYVGVSSPSGIVGQNVVGYSSYRSVSKGQEDDGQYHPENSEKSSFSQASLNSRPVGNVAGDYSSFRSVGQKTGGSSVSSPVGQQSGSSSFGFSTKTVGVSSPSSVVGQNVVGSTSYRSVSQGQEDDGQYHPENSEKSSFSQSSLNSRPVGNVAGDYSSFRSVGQKTGGSSVFSPVGQQSDSSSFGFNTKNVGVSSPSSYRSVNQGQEDDGQYHPENSEKSSFSQSSLNSRPVGNVAADYSSFRSVGQKTGGSSVSSPVGQQSGSSSFGFSTKTIGVSSPSGVVGQNVVGSSSYRSVSQGQEDDGQYHPDNSQKSSFSQSSLNSRPVGNVAVDYSSFSSVGQKTDGSSVSSPVGQQSGSSSFGFSTKTTGVSSPSGVVGQNVVGSSSYRSVSQGQEDDGQYHPENSEKSSFSQSSLNSRPVGNVAADYSSFRSAGQKTGGSSVSSPVGQQSGSSSFGFSSKTIGVSSPSGVVGQNVVGSSSYRSVSQGQEDDGQYHPENSEKSSFSQSSLNSRPVGNVAADYSSFRSVGQKTGGSSVSSPVGQQIGSSSFGFSSKTIGVSSPSGVVGQNVVGSSSYRSVNQGQEDDGQYHPDTEGQYVGQDVNFGNGNVAADYSSFRSVGQKTGGSSVSSPVGQQSGSSSFGFSTKTIGVSSPSGVVGQNVVGSSSYRSVNQGQEDDGQYHPENSEKSSYSQSNLNSRPVGNVAADYSSFRSVGQKTGGSLVSSPVGQQSGSSSFGFSTKTVGVSSPSDVVGQNVVGSSSYRSVSQGQEDDGQYHPENSEKSSFSQSSLNSRPVDYSSFRSVGQKTGVSSVSSPVGQQSGSSSFGFSTKTVGVSSPSDVVGQNVVGSSSYRSVSQGQEDDGQYHAENSEKSSFSQSSLNSRPVGNVAADYSSFRSVGQKTGVSSVSSPVGQQSGSSSFGFSTKTVGVSSPSDVVGQNVVGSSSYRSVSQGQEDDGQYHAENSEKSSYSQSNLNSRPVGNVAADYSSFRSVGQKTGGSLVSSPVGQQSGSSSFGFSTKTVGVSSPSDVVGQNVVGSSSYRSVSQGQEDDGQYHPENSEKSSFSQSSLNSRPVDYSSFRSVGQKTGVSSVSSPVGQQSGSSSFGFSTKTVGVSSPSDVVGQNVVGSSSYRSVSQGQEDDGQYHAENSEKSSFSQSSLNSRPVGNVAADYSSFRSVGQKTGGSSVSSHVGQQSGSSSFGFSTKTIGVSSPSGVVGQNAVGSSSYRSVSKGQEDDGQYHPENSEKSSFSQSSLNSRPVGNVAGDYSSFRSVGFSSFKTSGQKVIASSVFPTGQYGGSSSTVTSQNISPKVFGQQAVNSYRSVDQGQDDGQYHPDHSGDYHEGENDGQYHYNNDGQYVSQNIEKSSFSQSNSYSKPVGHNLFSGNVGGDYSSSSSKGVGQNVVGSSYYRSVSHGQEDDGQYHPATEGQHVGQNVNFGQNSFSSKFGQGSKVVGVSSNKYQPGSTFQSRTVVSQYRNPVEVQQTSFKSQSEVQSVKPYVQFQQSKQSEVFETAQPRVNVVPLGLQDMQHIHSSIQSAVSSKYGQQNDRYGEKHFGIIRKSEEFNDDGYHYLYETENGIIAEEEGHLVGKGTNNVHMEVRGFYSYTGPDNVLYTVEYSADSVNGFVPKFSSVAKNSRLPRSAEFSLINY